MYRILFLVVTLFKEFSMENEPFDVETQRKARELINAGRDYVGKFWGNRTRTAAKLGYGDWDSVPEHIRKCVNQIGRGAKARHAKERKQILCSQKPPVRQKLEGFVLSKDVLADISDRALLVPKNARPDQIKIIREYITKQAGFNPKKLLLPIHSYMEK